MCDAGPAFAGRSRGAQVLPTSQCMSLPFGHGKHRAESGSHRNQGPAHQRPTASSRANPSKSKPRNSTKTGQKHRTFYYSLTHHGPGGCDPARSRRSARNDFLYADRLRAAPRFRLRQPSASLLNRSITEDEAKKNNPGDVGFCRTRVMTIKEPRPVRARKRCLDHGNGVVILRFDGQPSRGTGIRVPLLTQAPGDCSECLNARVARPCRRLPGGSGHG
jgi:hypothetical protein